MQLCVNAAASYHANHAALLIVNCLCVYRYRDQRDRPDLSNPESMQLYLETRFEQLKVSNLFVVPLFCCVQGCHPVHLHSPIWNVQVNGCLRH